MRRTFVAGALALVLLTGCSWRWVDDYRESVGLPDQRVELDRRDARAYTRAWQVAMANAKRESSLVEAWRPVARCESGDNPHINTGNGYYGWLQWTTGTWHAYGGQGSPVAATRAQEAVVAERVRVQSGLHHWPTCGRLYRG